MEPANKITKLLVTDIDNTVFDWVTYYVTAFSQMLQKVAEIIGSDYNTLAQESRQIFLEHTIEYPFVVQELPSVIAFYGNDIDKMLSDCVEPARIFFKNIAASLLVPYEGVHASLQKIRQNRPDISIVALTDAPRYVAMWKLNKLGLLHDFDAVYGLADPRLPTDEKLSKVKVSPEILIKHLRQKNFDFKGRIRILPPEYEKPGTKGLKTVLMDYNLDTTTSARTNVLWVGDNLHKDVTLGHSLGITTAWAKYGANIAPDVRKQLETFGPPTSVRQSTINWEQEQEKIKPEIILNSFSEILNYLP